MDISGTKRNQKTAISYVCRDSGECIIKKEGKYIGDVTILVVETLAIQNTLKQAIKYNYLKGHVENFTDNNLANQRRVYTVKGHL